MTPAAAEPLPRRAANRLAEHFAIPVYVALSSVATAAWFAGAKLAWGDDATHPISLDRIPTYFRLLDAGLGGPDGRKFPFVLPIGGILEAWRLLHLPYSLTAIQPVVIVLLLATSASTMYMLIRVVLPSIPRLASFGGGLLYAFNLYSMTTIWSSMAYLAIHYAFIPLVILVWVTALRRGTAIWAIGGALIWAITLTPAYITTPVAMTDSTLFASIGLTVLATSPGRRLRTFVTGAGLYGVWLAVSLYWLIPLVTTTSAVTASGLTAGDSVTLFRENSTQLVNALRLGGYWGATSTYLGHPYYAWAGYYEHTGLAAGIAVPLIAGVGALLWLPRRRLLAIPSLGSEERRALWFALALAVVALFLMTGTHAPLGSLKATVVSALHLAGPFRSVYQRFGVYLTIAYGVLVAAGLGAIQLGAARLVRVRVLGAAVAAVAIVAAAVVPAWPMWTGRIMDSSGLSPARRITIPNDYARVANLIDQTSGDFDVLVYPFGGFGSMPLHWDQTNEGFYDRGLSRGYNGIEPLALMTKKGVLTSDGTAPYLFDWADEIVHRHKSHTSVAALLHLLNARFVVLHLDENIPYVVGAGHWTGIAVRRLAGQLDRAANLQVVYASPTLRVYSVNDWRPFRVFALSASPRPLRIRPGKIKPLRYRLDGYGRIVVDTHKLRHDQLLVVNRPFDPRWRADSRRPIDVNPGLTAFRVPSGRSRTMTLTYGPERRTRLALLLLPTTLLVFGGTLVVLLVRSTRRRRTSHA